VNARAARATVGRVLLGALVLALPGAVFAQTLGVATAPKPECQQAVVAMDVDVDSAHARVGDPFTFRTTSALTAPDGSVIPAGTLGYGTVQISQHAQRGGRGGYVVLDARFLAPAGGPHVPVTIDPVRGANAVATGGSGNIPGVVNAVPFVGYVTGPYAFIHHGHDVTIPRGAHIAVVVGDDAALGNCRIPAANEPVPPPSSSSASPATAATSQPSAASSPQPSTAPSPSQPPTVRSSPQPSASP
jgi:hypothetical protein